MQFLFNFAAFASDLGRLNPLLQKLKHLYNICIGQTFFGFKLLSKWDTYISKYQFNKTLFAAKENRTLWHLQHLQFYLQSDFKGANL